MTAAGTAHPTACKSSLLREPPMQFAALLAAAGPLIIAEFGAWARQHPAASDDEAKAELERLVSSDQSAAAEYELLKMDIEAAKRRLAGGGE